MKIGRSHVVGFLVATLLAILTFSYPLRTASAFTPLVTITVGSFPQSLVYDPGKGEIFVANKGSGTVSIISDTNNQLVANMNVGGFPYSLAYDSGKHEIFVVDSINGEVYGISDESNEVIANISLEASPSPQVSQGPFLQGIAYDAGRGELFVASSGYRTVLVISDTSDSIVDTIQVGHNPESVVYDSGKHEIFVCNPRSTSITGSQSVTTTESFPGFMTVISDTNDKIVATLNGLDSCGSMVYDPMMDEVFVTQYSPGEVSVISDTSNSVVTNIPITGSLVFSGLAYDSAKSFICVLSSVNTGQPNPVTVVSDGNNSIVGNFNGGNSPWALAYDSGRNEMFVANWGNPGLVSVIPDNAIPSSSSSLISGSNISLGIAAVISLVAVVTLGLVYLWRRNSSNKAEDNSDRRELGQPKIS